MKDSKKMKVPSVFFEKIVTIIEQARHFVGRTANLAMCVTYYEVGRMIVEEEQNGKNRAEYGATLLKYLSIYLNECVGKGFSESTLRNARLFYKTYSPSIQQSLIAEFDKSNLLVNSHYLNDFFKVSWTHYLILIRIKNDNERNFYEIESANNNWTVRELKRQFNSSLYERLALSRNKEGIIRLAKEGQVLERPKDILKDPLILDFLNLADQAEYSETDLENAIITKLQAFLLELGKGFLFEARQKRFTFDEHSFFVDLVFYNRLLQCYVLIDLKTSELKHQDLGQMLMYVNYFDRYVRKEFEKPTIGILLCSKKDDNIVELTLPIDSNIYASAYSLYLPDKTLLQEKLYEWINEFEEAQSREGLTKIENED